MDVSSPEFWEAEYKKTDDITSQNFWDKELSIQPSPKLPIKTVIEAGLVRKPATKKKIFAEARNIPESSYTTEKGKLYYTKEGKKYQEETNSLRDILIQAGTDPSTLMGIGGGLLASILAPGLGLPALAAIGIGSGMGGEYTRQRLADILYGEKTSTPEVAEQLGRAGLEGVIGESIGAAGKMVGRGAASLASRLAGSPKLPDKAVKILKKAGTFLPDYAKYVEEVQNRARNYGIELNLIESVENPITLKEFEKLAQKNYPLAIKRSEKIYNDIPNFIKKLFPDIEEKNISLVNKKAKELAQESVNDLVKSRRAIVGPFYEAAYHKNPIISTAPILSYIDELIDKSIPSHANALRSVRKDLLSRKKVVDIVERKLVEKNVPEMTLRQVDQFKRDIADPRLYKNAGIDDWTIIQNELKDIKNFLLDYMDKESPQYAIARATHALLKEGSPKKEFAKRVGLEEKLIEEYSKKGNENIITKTLLDPLTNKNFIKDVGQYVLFSKNSTPETVAIIKNRLTNLAGGKETWNQTIAEFLKNKALQLKTSPGGTINIGEQFWESIFGDKRKQLIMKNALDSTQYKALYNFMDIMRRTGIVFKTDPVSKQLDMTPQILEATRKAVRPFWGSSAVAGVKMIEFIRDKKNQDLINFIYDSNVSKRLANLKTTGNIEKVLYQMFRILGWESVETGERLSKIAK